MIIVLMAMGGGSSQLRRKRVIVQNRAPLRLLPSGKARGPRGTDGDRLDARLLGLLFLPRQPFPGQTPLS